MRPSSWIELPILAIVVFVAAFAPLVLNGYYLGIGIDILLYFSLATSLSLFSGPTHYISLATAAFFGIGGYLVGLGVYQYELSFVFLLITVPLLAAALAALIGFATLRLTGVYFVIFTLGLAEMIRNLVNWFQNNVLRTSGLYPEPALNDPQIFWVLLLLAAAVYLFGWQITRSRLGFALNIIGNDENVARHVGINTALAKVVIFTTTGYVAALVGVIMGTRFGYTDINSLFSPILSFFVVLMALLGGTHRLWGPLLGVIVYMIAWTLITAYASKYSTVFIGLMFLVIVYALPRGLLGRAEQLWARMRRPAP